MARFLYRPSSKRSASAPARRARTRSSSDGQFFTAAAGQAAAFHCREARGTSLMKTANDVLKAIRDDDVKYVDFRFTDPRGKWQHVTFDVSIIDDDTFAEGVMFDGSSIAGWKAI